MNDELERLDRLLAQLANILEAPGDEENDSAEWTWQKLDLLAERMGPDALAALLRRQGMSEATVGEALDVLASRRDARS